MWLLLCLRYGGHSEDALLCSCHLAAPAACRGVPSPVRSPVTPVAHRACREAVIGHPDRIAWQPPRACLLERSRVVNGRDTAYLSLRRGQPRDRDGSTAGIVHNSGVYRGAGSPTPPQRHPGAPQKPPTRGSQRRYSRYRQEPGRVHGTVRSIGGAPDVYEVAPRASPSWSPRGKHGPPADDECSPGEARTRACATVHSCVSLPVRSAS